MTTFSELAQRLEPFAGPPDDEEDGGWYGVPNGIVLGFAKSGLALWNEHAEKHTPGFVAQFTCPGELREYLERTSPDSFTTVPDECETTAARARDWMEVCRLLSKWAGEVEPSELAKQIMRVLDSAGGRLCVAGHGPDVVGALYKQYQHKHDPKVVREVAEDLVVRCLLDRIEGPKGGLALTKAGRTWLAR